MKLLIVEDHIKINQLLTTVLQQEGHEVTSAFTLQEALAYSRYQSFDVALIDLMLPDGTGESLITFLRQQGDTYVMVITAKVEVHQKLSALALGADDYITKPFSVEEVVLKVQNMHKRMETTMMKQIGFYHDELIIRTSDRRVLYHQYPLSITPNEYEILVYLQQHAHRIVSRDELFQRLLTESNAYDRMVDTYIKSLRKKLQDHPIQSRYIKTHYRLGYQFIGIPNEKL